MTTKPTFTDDYRWRLSEFLRRAAELRAHIKRMEKIHAPEPILAVLAPMMREWQTSPTHYVDPAIFERLQRNDPLYVNELLRILRLFRMKREECSLHKLVAGARDYPPPEIAETLAHLKGQFDVFPGKHGQVFGGTFDGVRLEISADEMRHLYENGEVFHGDRDKATKLRAVQASSFDELGYSLFMNKLVSMTQNVLDSYVVLRDAGWMERMADESEHLRRRVVPLITSTASVKP